MDTGKVSCTEQISRVEVLISSSRTEIAASTPAGNKIKFQKDTTEIVRLLSTCCSIDRGGRCYHKHPVNIGQNNLSGGRNNFVVNNLVANELSIHTQQFIYWHCMPSPDLVLF